VLDVDSARAVSISHRICYSRFPSCRPAHGIAVCPLRGRKDFLSARHVQSRRYRPVNEVDEGLTKTFEMPFGTGSFRYGPLKDLHHVLIGKCILADDGAASGIWKTPRFVFPWTQRHAEPDKPNKPSEWAVRETVQRRSKIRLHPARRIAHR